MSEETFYNLVKPNLVPAISEERVNELRETIKPLYIKDERVYEIDITNIDNWKIAFTWEPKLIERNFYIKRPLDSQTIMTFHKWGYYGFFKPSLGEVYACINAAIPKEQIAHIKYFRLASEEVQLTHVIGNYHWCYCHLYGESIKKPIKTFSVDDFE